MKRLLLLAFLLIPQFAHEESWARGGGGCLAQGTPVLTPSGPVNVEGLRTRDPVLGLVGGELKVSTVQALIHARPEELLEITAGERTLRATPEHPIMVAPGEYRTAEWLEVGDVVFLIQEGRIEPSPVGSIRRMHTNLSAYNLLVTPGGAFVAGGIVVHNKGCFLPESPILKADGSEVPVSTIRPGDELLAYTAQGRLVRTRVRQVLRVEADEFMVIQTDRATLRVTMDHPFYVGQGTFKTAESLKPGDRLVAWDGASLAGQRILSMETIRERSPVFNLQTDRPNTFFAAGLAVHNKGGGCFPAGTRIGTPKGSTRIEDLAAGDQITAVGADGRPVPAEVTGIFLARGPVLRLETDRGPLITTPEHPIGVNRGRFRMAGELRQGDRIVRWKEGQLIGDRIKDVLQSSVPELLFNLEVSPPHTFLAEGVLVHNKGGSFSRSSSSRSSRTGTSSSGGSPEEAWIGLVAFALCALVFLIIVIVAIKKVKRSKEENLDFVYSKQEVASKAAKTERLLVFLSQNDPSMSPDGLRRLAESTFRKLQECWQAREYGPMKSLMMESLFNQHLAQLRGLARNHEINRIEGLVVERVDLVNLRYTEKRDQREFTALVTASARDYYVDDRTGEFLRGDKGPARFQEFWTFQRRDDTWLLREIEQAGESDVLKDENYVEMLTDQTVQGIYAEAAGGEGPAGPWLEKGAERKASRIERMLNFLVQTDKIWDRNKMLERARELFLAVYLARESGDPAKVPTGDLFPEVAKDLQEQMRLWQMEGLSVEYRNLCVRKAELLLVRNFSDPAKDEFTVRINAHAQKVVRKQDRVLSEERYVRPFDEHWTFGRLDGKWKLKEVLPPSRAKELMEEENVDEESTPGQLQWYYRQGRAN